MLLSLDDLRKPGAFQEWTRTCCRILQIPDGTLGDWVDNHNSNRLPPLDLPLKRLPHDDLLPKDNDGRLLLHPFAHLVLDTYRHCFVPSHLVHEAAMNWLAILQPQREPSAKRSANHLWPHATPKFDVDDSWMDEFIRLPDMTPMPSQSMEIATMRQQPVNLVPSTSSQWPQCTPQRFQGMHGFVQGSSSGGFELVPTELQDMDVDMATAPSNTSEAAIDELVMEYGGDVDSIYFDILNQPPAASATVPDGPYALAPPSTNPSPTQDCPPSPSYNELFAESCRTGLPFTKNGFTFTPLDYQARRSRELAARK